MISCPYCGIPNIEGVDVCEQCGQSLNDLHLPDPTSAVERGLLKDRVGQLRPKPPVTVASETPLGEVLDLLVERRIGCVLVADGEKTVGVFSERDALLRVSADAETLKQRPIRDFMTPNPQGVKANDRIAFAVHQMDLGGYRHLPVLDENGRAEGVISVRDILGYLTSFTHTAE